MKEKSIEKQNENKELNDKSRNETYFTISKIIIGIIGIIIVIVIILFLNKKEKFNNAIAESENLSEKDYNVTESQVKNTELVEYEHSNFKMQIPSGWKVETAGDNMYFSIRVYNPNDDRYQIYSILKAEPLLKNEKAKTWYENYYKLYGGNKLLAEAIVVNDGKVENFYNSFNDYVKFAKEMGSTFNAPDLNNFAVIESFENNSLLKDIANDDKILRGTFQDTKTGKNGEGLFMATIMDMGSHTDTLGYDVLYYTAYNVMGITTGEYDLINYEELLTKSLNSLTYNDLFVNTTIENGKEQTQKALSMNAAIQKAYDSYNSAWSARQKTYDVTSQKYSDATLGYERVYDTNTGEIYKAYNGFTDDYDGSRYQTITDDMYAESVYGYIEKAK
ncbi:MAG: hypothetical protein Q4G05_00210 [Clostridia bacterium]|nr:hypothetical protein [Clostridia bacterium]